MSFDTATAKLVENALIARADNRDFVITSFPTSYRWHDHPLQGAFAPKTTDVLMVSWRSVYRRRALGDAFVCDAAMVAMATAAMLNHAQDQFGLIDQKFNAMGAALQS